MKMLLQRSKVTGAGTFGKLFADGKELCFTLEDPVREVAGRPVSEWKVHGKTAIPQGEYPVSLENSPRFGPDTLTVSNVPGFVGIRMHAGNTQADTEGCPLLGMEITDAGIKGGTSRPAVSLVKAAVQLAITRGERVTMLVTNP